jgi:hypothetical protein
VHVKVQGFKSSLAPQCVPVAQERITSKQDHGLHRVRLARQDGAIHVVGLHLARVDRRPEGQIESRCTAWVRQGRFIQAQGTEAWPDGTAAACYGFIHALYYEVVYQWVSAGQRLRLHQRIGARKESAYGSQARTIAAELAMHFVRGHDPQRALHYLRAAGENAMQ